MSPFGSAAPSLDATPRILTIVVLALVIRLAPLPLVVRLLPRITAAGIAEDGQAYYLPLARTLARAGEFAITPGQPYARHTPLYPFVLAGLERLGLLAPASVAALQALLGAAALVLIFVWVRRMAGPWPAFAAFLLAAVVPDFAAYSYLNLAEMPSIVLVLAALIAFQRALAGGGLAWWGATGAALGLAALTREFCITLLAPLALWSVRTIPASRAAARIAVMIAATVLVILPWTIRNYRLYGEFIPLTDKGGGNVYIGTLKGRHHASDARRMWELEDPRQAQVDRELRQRLEGVKSPSERSRLELQAAWRNVTDDPWGQVGFLPRKAWFFWQSNIGLRHGRRIGLTAVMALAELLYWLGLTVAVAGTLATRPDGVPRLFLWMLIGWIFVFHLFVGEAEPRYHFLALPFLFALAGRGLAPWLRPDPGLEAPRARTDVASAER